MSCFNFGGNSCCWIISLILLFFSCGCNGTSNNSDCGCGGCGCGNNGCGC